MLRKFNTQISVPAVNTGDEMASALQEMGAFSDSDLRNILSDLEIHTGSSDIGVGIRDIIECVKLSKESERDAPGRFAS